MKKGQEDQERAWARRGAAARAGGAASSLAAVWVTAGGASLSVELWWTGLGLSALSVPRSRADLAVRVEEALPGWLWSISEIPRADDERGAAASFALTPSRLGTQGGRGDSSMVRQAARLGARGERSVLSVACGLLDELAGGPSLRLSGQGAFAPKDWARDDWWRGQKELALPGVEAGGLRAVDFLAGLEAMACRQQLAATAEASGPARSPRRV